MCKYIGISLIASGLNNGGMTPHYFFFNNCNHSRISRDMRIAIASVAMTYWKIVSPPFKLLGPLLPASYDSIFNYINP
jgi:hypothetical protein